MNAKEARLGHDKHQKKGYTDKVEFILGAVSQHHKHLTEYTYIGTLDKDDLQQLEKEGYEVKVKKTHSIISW